MRISNIFCSFFLLMAISTTAYAQYFFPHLRPAGIEWQQIKTDHFRIIFPKGEDSLAIRSAEILEHQYPSAHNLTGGTLENFPIVLRNYNDLSNGFVSTLNFRSEIDLSPIKGKSINPAAGGWLENVLPHELVHATHLNVQQIKSEQKLSIPNFISYFSPDMARAFHGFVPYGFHEGLAVHYESDYIEPESGRRNYTYFTNIFNANFGSTDRWNIGQTFATSDLSQPYNRHYIAGSAFVEWLQESYGSSFTKDAIRFHYHNFMLGFGYTLKRKTGKWPGQLFALYEEDLEEREKQRLHSIPANTTERSRIIEMPFKGDQLRAPKWLNKDEILFYGSFYNARRGFYSYDLKTNSYKLREEAFVVGDHNYSLDDENNLIYSSYNGHAIYLGVYLADVHQVDLNTGKSASITKYQRAYSPTRSGDRIIAIQSNGTNGAIIEIWNDNIRVLKEFDEAIPIHLKVNPSNENQIAVILNQRGTQALWISSISNLSEELDDVPDLAIRNASIHDIDWHPDGNKILFSLDSKPAMNVYEYNLENGEIFQLTSSIYNAFEASYSPDAQSIAYVIQDNNEQKIAILNRNDFLNKALPDSLILKGDELNDKLNRPLIGEGDFSNHNWEIEDYRTNWSWLKPRLILPVVKDKSGTAQWGAGISSIDVLQSQSYYLELTGIQNKLWYDFTYSNRTFYPGFNLNFYNDPQFFATENPGTGVPVALMRQDRGISLSLPFEYVFKSNTRLSSFSFDPEISAEQFKYYDLAPNPISDFATRYKAGNFSQLNLNIRTLPRDVQPSSGFVLFGLLEKTLNKTSVELDFSNNVRAQTNFSDQWAAYYGAFFYVAPLQRWNQSLRVDLRFLNQSSSPIYSNSTIVPYGFSGDAFPTPFQGNGFTDLGRISTRYAIPLLYPDSGWLTLPLYLSSVYLTAFSHTVTDLNAADLLDSSRSIFGAGLHVQWKLSNMRFDFGIGVAFEPTRGNTQLIYGVF